MAIQDNKGETSGSCDTHGGRKAFQGLTYQLKLVMLFIIRGLTNKLFFRVETEVEEAGKWDDLVFKQSNGDCEEFSFLQVKHSAKKVKSKITSRNLLAGSKGDFNLPMYLQSYRMIRKNPKFRGKNKKIKKLILFTNKNFKYKDKFCNFELKEEIFEKIKKEDGINAKNGILKTNMLRFKKNFEGKSFLKSHLKNAFVGIPKRFAESVVKGEAFDLEQNFSAENASHSYSVALLKEVVDSKAQTFRPIFVEAVNLTPEAKHFRDVLKSECFNKHHGNEDTFQHELRKIGVKVIGKIKEDGTDIDKPENVAEKLASLLRRYWEHKRIVVYSTKCAIVKNLKVLAEHVLLRNENGEIRFRSQFISSNNLPESILQFRKLLVHEMENRSLDFTSIDQFQFEIVTFKEISSKRVLESTPDEEIIEEFLDKLVFAVDQPNVTKLETLIKEELLKEFEPQETENVYGRFQVKILKWMTEIRATDLSHQDIRYFFDNLKKEMHESVMFGIKQPSRNFTGRKSELTALKDALEDNPSQSATVNPQTVVITGTAGVGKTELAKKYASQHSGKYDNIIWIDAKHHHTIYSSFRKLAFEKLGIPRENEKGKFKKMKRVVNEVYDFLRGKKSLFVFDGAMKLGSDRKGDLGVRRFLPKSPSESKHYTLITSRNQNFGDIMQINLENFNLKDAVAFIRKYVSFESLIEISQAEVLAKALNCCPSALQNFFFSMKKHEDMRHNFGISDYYGCMSWCLQLFPPNTTYSTFNAEGTYYHRDFLNFKTRK